MGRAATGSGVNCSNRVRWGLSIMFNYYVVFAAPAYLALLAIVPVLVLASHRRLAALGPWRRWVVLALRVLLVALVVLALAEAQVVQTSDRLTVVYLLDQSFSIPVERRQALVDYVNADIREHRKDRDRAGVIVFGRDAAIEIPPFDANVQVAQAIESAVDQEYTNVSAAMKLAQALFPEDAAKRIVLVSDGNQNMGNAVEQAQVLSHGGVGIDVLPIHYRTRAEVIVERVSLPPDARHGEPFDLRVVITNAARVTAKDSGETPGRLVISRTAGGRTDVISEEAVVLPPGKKVFSIRQKIDSPDFYTYEARFIPDRPGDDASPQNNRATAFTHVQGKGQVLLIEDPDHRGEFAVLVDRLKQQGLAVEVETSSQCFSTLPELQRFDTVLLANVPREQFGKEQIAMLARNTQQMGAGLVMLGGPNSFGAGGWTDTEIEQAMPVDFQIKNAKIVPRGALALVIDNSSSMAGEKVDLCKAAAVASVKTLGSQDNVTVITFNGDAEKRVRVTRVGDGQSILRRIRQIAAGGGTNMYPGMQYAYDELRKADAAVKHMIVLSDGETMGEGYRELATRIHDTGITITTVAVGPQVNAPLLDSIRQAGGGKFYRVMNPKTLPRIFMKETRRVSRPLIWDKHPVQPNVKLPSHEILSGVTAPLPPITGYVMTTKKEGGPLIETLLSSPEPVGEENNTVLAAWTYGLGKAVAFTSDAGARWTSGWTREPTYDKLFGQMIRWSMRPVANSGKYSIATDVAEGQVRVVVNAMDEDEEFSKLRQMTATAVGPDLKPLPLRIEQTSPGRYVGSIPVGTAGSYFVTLSPGADQAPIRTGVTVPYSDEFRDRSPNDALLGQLAASVPSGGRPGKVIELREPVGKDRPKPSVDPFRHDLPKATSNQDAWHYLLLAACCVLFGDVFCRRVNISFAWALPLAVRVRDWVLRRQPKAAAPEFIERLQSRKAEVSDRFDQLRAATRFEAPAESKANLDVLQTATAAKDDLKKDQKPAAPTPTDQAKSQPDSYTERLLKAKKKVWEERDGK
jgi:Mg-chelatase subunit ChlD